jgi:hypothetical protein
MIRKQSLSMLAAMALAVAMLTGCQSKPEGTGHSVAYFRVAGAQDKESFVIALKDPETIAEARAIVSGQETAKVHVTGLVVPGTVAWNAPWHFYVHPDSISFFELSVVTCSATTSYVEQHLSEVGGAFLPGRRWCPFSLKVSEEIPAP